MPQETDCCNDASLRDEATKGKMLGHSSVTPHCINIDSPERHGDGLNSSYITYEITSQFVRIFIIFDSD